MTTETISIVFKSIVFTAIITTNKQITIPKAIRLEHGLVDGDIVELEIKKIVKKDKETKSSE